MFALSVGAESPETWQPVFEVCLDLEELDVPRCVVDQEKSIDTTFSEIFTLASIFLDKHRIVKNMSPQLGTERSAGIRSYEWDLSATTIVLVDSDEAQYDPKTCAYSLKFTGKELYSVS